MVRSLLVGALVLGGVTLPPTGATGATGAALPPAGSAALSPWQRCGTALGGSVIECATLRVPRDHARPGGRTISVGVARLEPTRPNRPVLFVNGGGPGISGFSWLTQFGDRVPGPLRRHFTIVGMDPRGLPNGTPLRCFAPAALTRFTAALGRWPATPATRDRTTRDLRSFSGQCRRHAPGLSRHLGSAETAADLEQLRRALGQRRLHYWGTSYGTILGAAYATQFPGRTGHMILDSVVQPNRSWPQLVRLQTRGALAATHRWADSCSTRPTCPYARDAFTGLRRTIERRNATATRAQVLAGERPGDALAMNVRLLLFYGEPYRAIDEAVTAARVSGAADDDALDAFVSTQWATRCTDGPDPGLTAARWPAYRRSQGARFPLYGAPLVWQAVPCIGARGEPLRLGHNRVAPLLLNGVSDPATPLAGARGMGRAFPRSSLAVWRGRGHGVLEHGGCTSVVVRFLTSGHRPPDGARCS